ncbi:MAG: PH domain-containing protein, partial [Candidatus Staskawiczbacteria bacterium]|nr:PH domain-containing protein [Candidatus Staskawiczbacteria bacterium]
TYTNYVFLMTENYFKIKRGIFSKTENAIPYRQIQNIDIERSFIFQLLGLSRLVILTAGHEDEKPKGASIGFDESEGIIPAIDQKLAEMLQTELLKRADVQRVIETK